MNNQRFIGILLAAAFVLLIPFLAMQFTDEVNWKPFDFMVLGVLLFSTGLLCEFVMRKIRNKDYQIGVLAVIVVALFLAWAELAVGIFGTALAGS